MRCADLLLDSWEEDCKSVSMQSLDDRETKEDPESGLASNNYYYQQKDGGIHYSPEIRLKLIQDDTMKQIHI